MASRRQNSPATAARAGVRLPDRRIDGTRATEPFYFREAPAGENAGTSRRKPVTIAALPGRCCDGRLPAARRARPRQQLREFRMSVCRGSIRASLVAARGTVTLARARRKAARMRIWKQAAISLVVLGAAGLALGARLPGRRGASSSAPASPPPRSMRRPPPEPAPARRRGGGRPPAPRVIGAAVGTATINDSVSAIGDGRAARSVTVTPYVAGRVVSGRGRVRRLRRRRHAARPARFRRRGDRARPGAADARGRARHPRARPGAGPLARQVAPSS